MFILASTELTNTYKGWSLPFTLCSNRTTINLVSENNHFSHSHLFYIIKQIFTLCRDLDFHFHLCWMMADKENLRSVNLIQVKSNVNVCFDGGCKKKTSHFHFHIKKICNWWTSFKWSQMSMFVLTAVVKRRLHTFSLRSLTQNTATVSWENILTKKLSNIFPFTIFFKQI